MNEKLNNLGSEILLMQAVGSRVTCNPPVLDTDEDWLLLLKPDTMGTVLECLCDELGWDFDGSEVIPSQNYIPENDRFQSVSREGLNLILTESPVFYKRFLAATSIAKSLNLLDKTDRINLFQAVLYGNELIEESGVLL